MRAVPLLFVLLAPAVVEAAVHPLTVARNGRHLVRGDGKPFLYLADTAWELFHRLSREEAEVYLANRAAKGFTVVQAALLAELEGLTAPNARGELPLQDRDPRRPNPKYFEDVDHVLARAEALGLTVGMLPTWGDKFHSRFDKPGPRVFDDKNAYIYARFVGTRYRDRNVIFILGGDRNVDGPSDAAITRAFARGLKETAPRNLITYHPRGPGRSSDFVHRERWLDFNMIQSSHTGRDYDPSLNIDHDRGLRPVKPTLDGEPRYEAIPVDFYYAGARPTVRFDDSDVRIVAWRALLAGAAGHTYGNNNVWQMWAPAHKPVIDADTPWREALDHPGAFQMLHVRRLFESRPWERLEPTPALLATNPGGPAAQRAALATDRSFALAYTPVGDVIVVNLSAFGTRELVAWWYDPRYGRANRIAKLDASGVQAFTPPTSGRGQDWVLVIDDAARAFGPPGRAVHQPLERQF